MKKTTVTFIYAGLIERGGPARGYRWCEGWSENGTMYPWLTKREAQAQARRGGKTAVFVRNVAPANTTPKEIP